MERKREIEEKKIKIIWESKPGVLLFKKANNYLQK